MTTVAAQYILAVLACAFLLAGAMGLARSGLSHPQSRTWLLIGIIFGAVSAWLFYRG
jgi:bacteriorhodopsin